MPGSSRWSRLLSSVHGKRRVPALLQMNSSECGATCLAMILTYYGRRTSVAEIRQQCGPGRDGLSALALVKAAQAHGIRARALAVSMSDFRYLTLPVIVHWEFNHFLVVERWSPHYVSVVDPALGRRRLSVEEFDNGFTGVALLLEPGVQFHLRRRTSRPQLWAYLRSSFRFSGSFAQILSASLILQVLGLVFPLLTGVFVDQVIPSGLENLMPLLALGMLVVVLTQTTTSLLRTWLLVYLQARVDMAMMLNFFEHLLSLSYQFFQQRSSGDLLSRMTSNIAIRNMLTNQMLSSLLDGGTVITYLVVLLSFSPILALCALVVGLLQVTLLLLSNHLIYHLTRRDLIAQGKAQGYMTEALMGIATIKAAGAEQRAFDRWANLFFEHINVSVRRDAFSSTLNTLMGGLRSLAPLLLLWVGTLQVLHGTMTLGTMLALNALAAAFLIPLGSLASSGLQLQQVRAHFERILDVLEAEPEQNVQNVHHAPRLTGHVELQQVSFRYDVNAPLVLQNINLRVKPGQKIALVGRTGSGKSTLGKLLLGLYLPTEGTILYDDHPLQSLNYQEMRSQFGVVLQESAIFSGSIRENIALNNPAMDMEQVTTAARAAAIHDDILQMPMEYETAVAEGGSALSGGQRQRLSIARALASQPTILLLDEATSHLDVVTEQVVDRNLNTLDCTRIVIAHRLSTICNADLILVLHDGSIVERGTHRELMGIDGYYAQLIQNQISLEEEMSAEERSAPGTGR